MPYIFFLSCYGPQANTFLEHVSEATTIEMLFSLGGLL